MGNAPESTQRGNTNQTTNSRLAVSSVGDISASDLFETLAEAAGKAALEDAILDRALDRELVARQIIVTPVEIQQERERLLAGFVNDAHLSEPEADRALANIRAARGLGPRRFAALLARNAKLRRLVAQDIAPTEPDIERELALTCGSQTTARIIVLSGEREASEVRAGLAAAGDDLAERFTAMARARSLDASAREGGVIGPISPEDPRVPGSLRSVLATQAVGELSQVIALDSGFALALIDARTPGATPTPQDRTKAENAVRARLERLAMEREARRMITEAQVRVLDESLRWSWER